MIKVYLIDDHSLVRNCIKTILASDPEIEVVGEADNGESGLIGIKESKPDVAIIDVMMPGLSCIDIAHRLRRLYPKMNLIILTASHNQTLPKRFLDLGVLGYVTKEAGGEEIVTAVKKVYQGKLHITPEVAQKLFLNNLQDRMPSGLEQLSDRELEILMMIINGHQVSYIADKLCLSAKTVNSHRYRIFKKLNVENDVELTHFAVKNGLLEVSTPDKTK